MSTLYECNVEGCTWRNPDWRYGLADAGMSWAMHMDDHRRTDLAAAMDAADESDEARWAEVDALDVEEES